MISEALFIDNMKHMKTIEDKWFDLVIADPQYGINAVSMRMGTNKKNRSTAERVRGRLNHGNGKLKNRLLNSSTIDWDDAPPPPEYFEQLFRISRHQIIWGANYFHLPPTRGIIFWDKLQPWENFSQFELAWTSFDVPAAKIALSNTGGSNQDKKIHPTEKPIKLYRWLLQKYAKPGWRIYDPNMGSQNSRIAADIEGFDYWGCENNVTHYSDGCDKYLKHKGQPYLPF